MSILPVHRPGVSHGYAPTRPVKAARKVRKRRKPTRPRPRPAINPRLSWPAWTDTSTWVDTALVMDDAEARAWIAADRPEPDSSALHCKADSASRYAATHIEYPVSQVGKPFTIAYVSPDDGYSPMDDDRFEPDPYELAWWSGYCLGVEGEYPSPPAHYTDRQHYWFNCGRLAGFADSPDGIAWAEDMAAARDRIATEVPFSELAEANGYSFAINYAG